MKNMALIWLMLNFFAIIVSALYSLTEMACVSLNRIRLHYWVAKGEKKALFLNWLLQHPFRLFGTTLIGNNIANTLSSEFSREFHQSIGINPDFAPLSQVLLVIIFGELAPMFAARHYPENVAWLGAAFLYYSAKLMTPLLWIVGWISRGINTLLGAKNKSPHLFLSQEELQKVLEENRDEPLFSSSEDINIITSNIFDLRKKKAIELMTPVKELPLLDSNASVADARNLFSKTASFVIGIYYKSKTNIIGIVSSRELIRAQENKKAKDFSRSPWFVTENTECSNLLQQFQHNKETVAVIIDSKGKSVGLIHIDDILEEIFGRSSLGANWMKSRLIVERTFAGDMLVSEFERIFERTLDEDKDQTLSEILSKQLGHHPEPGDSIIIGAFEIEAKECTLLDVKSVIVKSRL